MFVVACGLLYISLFHFVVDLFTSTAGLVCGSSHLCLSFGGDQGAASTVRGCCGHRGARSQLCHPVTWVQTQRGAQDVSLGPPASFALMRCRGTSQSLSGRPTSRAAFLINRPLAVLALFSPLIPPFLCWQQPMP